MDMPTQLKHGDSLEILPTLPRNYFDAIITDPPYSSGGMTITTRTADPAKKYVQHGSQRFAKDTFTGDNRDQLSWCYWSHLWLSMAFRATRPGGYCLLFTDWRQLPATTNVLQGAGFIWRGIISWNKGRGARAPHKGFFRQQCEYVVWGTKGKIGVPSIDDPRKGPWDGCIDNSIKKTDKHHMTGKPTPLMRQLVQCVPPGGRVLDPFMGSGTTVVASVLEGRHCVGIEAEQHHFETATRRLEKAMTP